MMKKIANRFKMEMIFLVIILFVLYCLLDYSGFSLLVFYHPFTLLIAIWNILPIVICYFLFKKGLPFRKTEVVIIMLILAGIALVLFPVILNLQEVLVPHDVKYDSSTGGLIFLFIPFWAILFGIIPAIVLLVSIYKQKKLH